MYNVIIYRQVILKIHVKYKRKFNLIDLLIVSLFKLKSHFLFKDVHMKLHQYKNIFHPRAL